MTAPRVCYVVAALLFVLSCVFYRKMHETAGDRLLFLAYGAVLMSLAMLIEEVLHDVAVL